VLYPVELRGQIGGSGGTRTHNYYRLKGGYHDQLGDRPMIWWKRQDSNLHLFG
jgi:hypothetical protein